MKTNLIKKNMKKIISYLFLSLIIFSCSSNDDENNTETTTPTGIIQGKIMTSNGQKPVGGALVFTFDQKNEIYYTYTNESGKFSFPVPTGAIKVYIQTGNGTNFRSQFNVDVAKNQIVEIEQSMTLLNQTATMAYVVGRYDNIEDIITSLGYEADAINFTDLSNYNTISQYDVIYLNCGSISGSISSNPTVSSNLAKFVTNGGSIYASDWSIAYLIGGDTNSSVCGEVGGFIPDSTLCSINNGSSGLLNGTIINTALSNAIGFSTLDINYDLGSWQKTTTLDETFWQVLVKNTATNSPLMIKTNQFFDSNLVSSRVGTTDNNFVTICHQTGNAGSITITINESALPAHLAHGDTLGNCSNTNSNGTIYYTTFHNHASGNIGNSQLILEHIILNL